MKFVPGCSCCVGPCDWTITVKGCGGVGYPGVTVTVVDSGGGTVSGTTNGSGIVTFTGLATGTATATSTAPNARWVNTSVIKTLVAGANTSNLSMSSATGYIFLGCLDPASTTLYYSAYRLFDHSGACNPETLSNPLTFSGTSDWSGEYLPAFATPPTTDGRVRGGTGQADGVSRRGYRFPRNTPPAGGGACACARPHAAAARRLAATLMPVRAMVARVVCLGEIECPRPK